MPRLIEPGAIVKWKANQLGNRQGAPAILLSMNGTDIRLLDDVGTAKVLRHEIIVPRMPLPAFEPMILRLPYGVWTEEDGSRVLFSRDYYPLWRIPPDGHVTPEDPWRWIFVFSLGLNAVVLIPLWVVSWLAATYEPDLWAQAATHVLVFSGVFVLPTVLFYVLWDRALARDDGW